MAVHTPPPKSAGRGKRPGTGRLVPGRSRAVAVTVSMCVLGLAVLGLAQPPGAPSGAPSGAPPGAPSDAPPTAPPAPAVENLATKQSRIAERYARLEQLLIRMSEVEATSNPQRAALLKRAAQQSAEKLTRQQLNALVKLLAPPSQLKRATNEQGQVVSDLKALLELLQSENRADRLKSEQARVKDYIKEVDRLIRLQRGVQGRTEGGEDLNKLAEDQNQIGDRTGQLAQRIAENEEGRPPEAKDGSQDGSKNGSKDGSPNPQHAPAESGQSGQPSSDKSADKSAKPPSAQSTDKNDQPSTDNKSTDKSGKNASDKGGDQKTAKGGAKSGKGEKGGDAKSAQSGKSGEPQESSESPPSGKEGKSSQGQKSGGKKSKASGSGEPAESPDSESPPDAGQPPDEQEAGNPARKRLEAAEQRMREAERNLKEAKQKEATAEQERAREELEKAKAELEQILRQMREEEIERTLALLEGRFRQMLEAELKIHETTKRLDKIPAGERSRDVDIQASKLAFDQGKVAVDADRALLLLREEGSSVAFPETVEMMRDDMQQVADRLSSIQVDRVTQAIEEEIIQTLEELVAALQKAQQDLKDKPPPPPSQPQQPMDPSQRPLVDQLSELKMIRSLQLRVNTRTQRYARLLQDVDDPVGRANDRELRESLIKLSEMELRIHEITRNLVLGKNR